MGTLGSWQCWQSEEFQPLNFRANDRAARGMKKKLSFHDFLVVSEKTLWLEGHLEKMEFDLTSLRNKPPVLLSLNRN